MKKFLKIGAILFLFCAILLGLVVVFLPYLANLKGIKDQIEKQIAKRLQTKVDISEFRLALVPCPGLKLKKLRLKAPTYTLKVQAASLNFRLRAIFNKRLEIRDLVLKRPQLIVFLPGKAASPKLSLQQRLKKLLEHVPLIELTVEDGDLEILRHEKQLFHLENLDLDAEVRRDQILFEAQSMGKAWKTLSLSFKLWPQTGFLEGVTEVEHLNISVLPFLASYLSIENIETDLSMDFSFRRENRIWYLGFRTTAPCLAKDPAKGLIFSCNTLVGEARISPTEKWISIKQAVVKYPEIVGHGEFHQSKDKSLLKIEIKDTDFTTLRQKLLSWSSRNKNLSRFFKILHKAKIGRAIIVSTATAPKGLARLKNINLEAEVFKAEVHLPIFPKPLKIDHGICSLHDRILYVKNAEGIYRDNTFTEGRLKIFLFDRDEPFLFESKLEADAQEALTEVKRLVRHHRSLYENLNKIKKIKGRAEGYLKVYGNLRHPKVNFSIKPQKVFLLYKDLPFGFTLSKGNISYADQKVTCISLRVELPKSRLESLSGSLDFTSRPFFLNLTEARGIISTKELNPILKLDPKIKRLLKKNYLESGKLYLVKALFKGPLTSENLKKQLIFEAQAKDVSIICTCLPGRLEIKEGLILYKGEIISLGMAKARLLDTNGTVSGEISSIFNPSLFSMSLKGQARLGPRFIEWIFDQTNLSKKFFPSTPLKSPEFEFWFHKDLVRLSGSFITGENTKLYISLEKKGPIFRLSKAKLLTGKTSPELAIFISPQKVAFHFQGCLKGTDFDRIFANKWLELEILEGQIKGTYYLKDITHSEFRGKLELKNLNFPWNGENILISKLEVQGKGSKILIKDLKANIKQTEFLGHGKFEFTPKNICITGAIHTTKIIIEEIIKAIKVKKNHKKSNSILPIILTIDIKIDNLLVRNYIFKQVKGTLFYYQRQLKLVIEDSNLCGINLIGEISWSKGSHSFRISYSKKRGDLNELMVCLFKKPHMFEGVYTLNGNFIGYGEKEIFLKASSGKLFFSSQKGKIYKFGLIVKLFAFLNPIDIFRGNLPDLSQKGFSYDFWEIKGHFEKQDFVIDESQIQGTGLRIFASGKTDLKHQKIYLTALISPFVEMDTLISGIPVIGWVLTGKTKTFFSIPVDIRGNIKDPEIIPLNPRAVSKKLLGIIERSLKLPVKVFIPHVPSTNQNGK